jgi:hypothetical protein
MEASSNLAKKPNQWSDRDCKSYSGGKGRNGIIKIGAESPGSSGISDMRAIYCEYEYRQNIRIPFH